MTIEKTYVVNFTEEDKETLRRVYKMIRDFDCEYVSTSCISCPFHGFCDAVSDSAFDDELVCEENFIKLIREKFSSLCNNS